MFLPKSFLKNHNMSVNKSNNERSLRDIVNNKEKWELENIFDKKSFQAKIQFLLNEIKRNKDRKWCNICGFDNSSEIFKDFYTYYLNEPRFETRNKTKQNNKTMKIDNNLLKKFSNEIKKSYDNFWHIFYLSYMRDK